MCQNLSDPGLLPTDTWIRTTVSRFLFPLIFESVTSPAQVNIRTTSLSANTWCLRMSQDRCCSLDVGLCKPKLSRFQVQVCSQGDTVRWSRGSPAVPRSDKITLVSKEAQLIGYSASQWRHSDITRQTTTDPEQKMKSGLSDGWRLVPGSDPCLVNTVC